MDDQDKILASQSSGSKEKVQHKHKNRESQPRKIDRLMSEQELQKLLLKAHSQGSLRGLDPRGKIQGDSLLFQHVPTLVFKRLQETIAKEASISSTIKLDCRRRSTRAHSGRLTVTMPCILHQWFKDFTWYIERDMTAQNFLPGHLDPMLDIIQTGRTAIALRPVGDDRNLGKYQPDSSLAILERGRTFLVVEFAHPQNAQAVARKAEDYICGAKPPINFVIVIYIDTATSAAVDKLEPGDTVTVSVYTRTFVTTPEGDKRKMTTLIERHEVWPTPATEILTIRWADVNCGTWQEYAALDELDPDCTEPQCTVRMAHLSTLAQKLAGPNVIRKVPPIKQLPGLYSTPSPDPTMTPTEDGPPNNDAQSSGLESYVPPTDDSSSKL